jgi:hypothetical protein
VRIQSSSCLLWQPDNTGQTRRSARKRYRSYTTTWDTIWTPAETVFWSSLRKTLGERFGEWPIAESVFIAVCNWAVGAKLVHKQSRIVIQGSN